MSAYTTVFAVTDTYSAMTDQTKKNVPLVPLETASSRKKNRFRVSIDTQSYQSVQIRAMDLMIFVMVLKMKIAVG